MSLASFFNLVVEIVCASLGGWRSYKKTFTDKGLQFGVTTDLVGKVWDEDSTNTRPAESNNQVFPLEQKFAG